MPFDDDVSLVGDIELVRVLVDKNWYGQKDDGSERASSAAFADSNNETSCFLVAETDLALIAARFPNKKFALITAAAARDAGYIIARDDDGGDGIPGHVLLISEGKEPVRSSTYNWRGGWLIQRDSSVRHSTSSLGKPALPLSFVELGGRSHFPVVETQAAVLGRDVREG
jgi:hypothetical protein